MAQSYIGQFRCRKVFIPIKEEFPDKHGFFLLRQLSRLFNTEACLNGSFLSLPDTHFRTSSNNPGIDVNQVIEVMEKLRSCDPKIQEMVRLILSKSFLFLCV